jgi:hypothetical protein
MAEKNRKHPFKPTAHGAAYATMRHLTNHRQIEGKELVNQTGPTFGEPFDRWRYASIEDYVTDVSILEDVEGQLAERAMERFEREVLGAWMAGYDYLYTVHTGGLDPLLFIPSDSTEPPYDPGLNTVERYDLRWLFPQDVQEVR